MLQVIPAADGNFSRAAPRKFSDLSRWAGRVASHRIAKLHERERERFPTLVTRLAVELNFAFGKSLIIVLPNRVVFTKNDPAKDSSTEHGRTKKGRLFAIKDNRSSLHCLNRHHTLVRVVV